MDQIYTNFRTRVVYNRVIHIQRHLPNAGRKVDVSVGQEVGPGDILGQGQAPAGFRTIHLSAQLQENPKNAQNYLKRKIGQAIYEGELLAAKTGLFGLGRKNIICPVDGIIDFYDINNGNLRIKHLPKVVKVASGVWGVVDKVEEGTGIILIRTMASLVHGLLGCGRERSGSVKVLGSAEDLVSSRQIVDGMRGEILVAGGIILLEALQKAVNVGVGGIISGGINARDFRAMVGGGLNLSKKHWSDVGISLLLTEGFGAVSIGEDIFRLLKGHHGKFALLDGNRARLILPSGDPDSIMDVRRTRLPVGVGVEPDVEVDLVPLKIGSWVRLLGNKQLGVLGKVESLDKTPSKLPCGIMTYLVTVVTVNRKIKVPYLNLEVVEV